ncbi:MAG: GWxTD domain-containing protein [Candidatus Aminicenantes bacterium]|nr:GWxTD domain-containing protein [Candidatus Aminicenantes bacterium]NIM85031.1 GWxTD domain-containing protein [Candidatus Aminicenantes bacterium]NIN24545.1 GWxTD domain-containing protein [Candidatus Aminicenantes bacterium]NIN48309.1 GWxTD domain-containing protein [Candidatus Aminicenantes bacterium]NIN91212.1 GWxTD domain-containing protein [Candidatus Aminicenantes bacterium]
MKKNIVVYILIVLFIYCLGGCSQKIKFPANTGTDADAAEDTFFQTAQFIMTKEEKNIYRHLPDQQAREEFIEDFWKKRDPTPETHENENQVEFERRIEYANKWFKDRPDGRWWYTDRGRILLQLGIPDERYDRVSTVRGTTWMVKIDTWYYYQYQLVLQFVDKDGYGRYRLLYWPMVLSLALDQAAFALDLDGKALNRPFRFNVKFKQNIIKITVPVKNIEFQEKDGRMIADFEIEVFVYRDFKKIDHFKLEKHTRKTKEEILQTKNLEITVPYSLQAPGKGSYYLDVIIKEVLTSSRYRNFSRFKI